MRANRQRRSWKLLARRLYASLPVPGVSDPVIIVGCGRSGTTALGRALSEHPRVAYLNEARHLWSEVYPQTDIWSRMAPERGGQLALSADEASPARSLRLRRLFHLERIRKGRKVLVEKNPANCLRLGFVRAVFPDARFIHIYRNGLEVARSVAKEIEQNSWFGHDSYKWRQLTKVVEGAVRTADLPPLCSTPLDMGLLEWRIYVEASVGFLGSIGTDRYREVCYDELTRSPVETINRLLDFMGLPHENRVEAFARNSLARRSPTIEPRDLSEREMSLGGPLLGKSMTCVEGLVDAGTA